MSETNYFRLIEAYFEGNISSAERAMLEAKIKTDPLLKAEFDLQKNIIKGISNARNLQLKSRLASIDLPTHTAILTGSGVKWLAGTVAGVTLFGSLLYWSLISFDQNIVPLDINTEDKISFNYRSLSEFPALKDHNTQGKTVTEARTPLEVAKIEKEEIKTEEKIIETATVQPQSLMSYDDDNLFSKQGEDELEKISSREVVHNRADKTEIEFFDAVEDKNIYHYRYYNSKLYLYGDFKEKPYEIIELNDRGSKQLFLSHNDEVYLIQDNTTETTELKGVEDEMLKMEIQLISEE